MMGLLLLSGTHLKAKLIGYAHLNAEGLFFLTGSTSIETL